MFVHILPAMTRRLIVKTETQVIRRGKERLKAGPVDVALEVMRLPGRVVDARRYVAAREALDRLESRPCSRSGCRRSPRAPPIPRPPGPRSRLQFREGSKPAELGLQHEPAQL